MAPGTRLSDEQLEQLLEVGRMIVSELDLEAVLGRVLEAARDLTGASYAALGILNADKSGLDRFLHVGIDEATRRAIGPLPRGRGLLGELIVKPRPLRLADVSSHPRSYGFPPSHPPMKSFLGTPIVIRGEAWGNVYLTEKEGGAEFDDADEQLVVTLAAWAAVAIDNARLYDDIDVRRVELERALRGLEASSDISRTVNAGIEVEDLLELIAKRGRDVVDAHVVMVLLSDGEELEVEAAAGHEPHWGVGPAITDHDSWLADVYEVAPDLRGLEAMAAELSFRDRPHGYLIAFRGKPGEGFDAGEHRVFSSFAASAATTIATTRAVEAEKLQLQIDASENERRRWARELHDETLQELGALRVVLETGVTDDSALPAELRERAIEYVDRGIQNLQGLISELRPAVLDELGVQPAIETLARQAAERSGVEVEAQVELPEGQQGPERLEPNLEATVYRLVQEGVNNALKHADAQRISIDVGYEDDVLTVTICDDGAGFDPDVSASGFGLIGMRERVALTGGKLSVVAKPGDGAEVRAQLPLTTAATGRSRGGNSVGERSRSD